MIIDSAMINTFYIPNNVTHKLKSIIFLNYYKSGFSIMYIAKFSKL